MMRRQCQLLSILSLWLAPEVVSGQCVASKGYKKSSATDDAKCKKSLFTPYFSCSNCCELDTTVCAGNTLGGNAPACGSDKYRDPTKGGAAVGADATTKTAACCTARATCSASGYTCAAGFEKKTGAGASDVKCNTDAASCSATLLLLGQCCKPISTCAAFTCPPASNKKSSPPTSCGLSCLLGCCDADTTKCGANVILMGAFCLLKVKGYDPTKAGTAVGATDTTKEANCCVAAPTCATFTCIAGSEKKTGVDTQLGLQSTCCKAITTTCGGDGANMKKKCDAATDMIIDISKFSTAKGTTTDENKAACCKAQPTCGPFRAKAVVAASSTPGRMGALAPAAVGTSVAVAVFLM